MSTKSEGGGGVFAFLFMLPLMIASALFTALAFFLAKAGVRYRIVKFVAFPTSLLFSNILALFFGMALTLMYSAFTGDKAAVSWMFENMRDVTLFVIWGPIVSTFWNFGVTDFSPQVPITSIIFYQLVTYIFFGRAWSRHFSLAIFDAAIVRIAFARGEQVFTTRQAIAQADAGYAKDALFYEKRGRVPALGFISVAIAGGSPGEFYCG
jgi:hypothetical protein